MKCYICLKEGSWLCKEHAQAMKDQLNAGGPLITNPEFKHHCQLCGDYQGKILIEYTIGNDFYGFYCTDCINKDWSQDV